MRAIESGRLRHLIKIERRTIAQDSEGGQIEAWNQVNEVWAEVAPQKGREIIAAGALANETLETIRIRYLADISTDDRLIVGGVVYAIRSCVNAGGLSAVTEMVCARGFEQR